MADGGKVEFVIRRQDGPGAPATWDTFLVERKPRMNVISALQAIRSNPVTADGRKVPPPSFDCGCLEEVCGACTMVINGIARQACSALVDALEEPVRLEPLSKFPMIRDLVVDRSVMFENLKRVKAWVPIDGTHDLGPGPRMPEIRRQEAYQYSRCMTCGCCMEACPQVKPGSAFIGPAALGQVKLFNMHPTGAMIAHERLDAIMGEGGIAGCGNAQNCVRACPKQIPLTEAIADLNWNTNVRWLQKFLGFGPRPGPSSSGA
ncbi:MAG: succinate dehydrogenase iron-sulfur subunit [Planctomycetota bacterium]|nr:succinate dehydrogenase iron-sulfur subunit [Planctomycetota bacterium]